MSFNKKVWSFLALIIIVNSCARPVSPEWEDLTSSPKPVLTVMALLSLNPEIDSEVRVYRTMDVIETSEVVVGRFNEVDVDQSGDISLEEVGQAGLGIRMETLTQELWLWYADLNGDSKIDEGEWDERVGPTNIPSAVIENAVVTVVTPQDSINFLWEESRRAYFSSLSEFVPDPLVKYKLHISAPGYSSVTGQLTTPPIPRFLQDTHEETLFVDSELIFKWESEGGSKGRLLGRIPYTELDLRKDSDQIEQIDRNCWSRNEPVDLGDLELKGKGAMWADLCGKLPFPQNYVLTLVGMDVNYHEYFVRGEQKDYENLFLSDGTTGGWGVGIDGGYGVFGAISSDRMERLIMTRSD